MTNEKNISRRNFVKGAATGVCVGALASMGVYSYTSSAYNRLPKMERKMESFGTCRSVKITNISETSWFNNAHLIGDIHEAGGLLVNQYTLNWAPFANGKGSAQGSYESGIGSIRNMLPNDLEEAWAKQRGLSLHPGQSGRLFLPHRGRINGRQQAQVPAGHGLVIRLDAAMLQT